METCSQFKVVIDLDKMIESDIADWLKKNGRFICFDDTHGFIEEAHKIKQQTTINQIEQSNLIYTSYSLKAIKDKILAKGANFDFDRYFCYLTLTRNENQIVFDLLNDYDSNRNCYSIPCLRSIVLKNNFSDDTLFEFAEAIIDGNTTIIFRVKTNSPLSIEGYDYYDYSDEPKRQFIPI